MTDSQYILATTEADDESTRLSLLEKIHDSDTTRRLDALGLGAGDRCLEVGAGRGSIARWLAAKVGPQGRVVAADIDCRFLRDMPENVEVRRLDIRTDELEADSYDLVHCRALLAHMPDPLAVVRRMAAALRPGGVLLAEEPDFATIAFGGHPDAGWATAASQRAWAGMASAKLANLYLGRDLAGIFSDVGLDVIDGEVTGSVARFGDPEFEFWRLSGDATRPGMISAGLLTTAESARLRQVMSSPDTLLTTYVVAAVSGRRVS